jgi:hypothetical protein
MANAEGGQFVYGMTEVNHLPAGLDAGIASEPFNGLWFEQVIQQNVRPTIEGLIIIQIPIEAGKYATVISVPKSTTVHQAKDGRYYRRRNFRNDIMPDYEIREAMNRSSTSEPYVEIELPEHEVELKWTDNASHCANIGLITRVGNKSREPALYTYVTVYLDTELVMLASGAHDVTDASYSDGHPMKALSFPLVTPHHFPLFQEKTFKLGNGTTIAISPKYRELNAFFRIAYDISTPGYAVFRSGQILKTGNRLKLDWEPLVCR